MAIGLKNPDCGSPDTGYPAKRLSVHMERGRS
jgi:hypothetical protein